MQDQTANGPTKLAEEWAAFEKMRDSLLEANRDKWALFKGNVFLGVFDTFEAAYAQGVQRFGNQPFLCVHIKDRSWHVEIPALDLKTGKLSGGGNNL